jgi:hypothetical protein
VVFFNAGLDERRSLHVECPTRQPDGLDYLVDHLGTHLSKLTTTTDVVKGSRAVKLSVSLYSPDCSG